MTPQDIKAFLIVAAFMLALYVTLIAGFEFGWWT